ncbi:hypothetical protein BCF11_3221 [Collimonas sp. PA-H2]|nr:hypothetical protein BCF11_3221 [Collimonas sp. PA-H2]
MRTASQTDALARGFFCNNYLSFYASPSKKRCKIRSCTTLFIKIGYYLVNIPPQHLLPHPQKLEFAHGIPTYSLE